MLSMYKMASKKRVSHDDRVKMIVLRDEGYSLQEIASKLKCNHSTVCITLAKQRECGTVGDRKRSGRPRISTPRDDRALQRICLQREWEQSSGVTSSARTVRRRLDDVGLVCLVVWPEKSHSLLIGIDSYDFSGPRSERIGERTNGTRWYGLTSPNLTYLEVMAEFTLGEGKAKIICRSAYSQQ